MTIKLKPMNSAIKTKWINALTSGQYLQGTGTLKDTIQGKLQFCCLGVLCDLYSKENGKPWTESGAILNESVVLPLEVMDWAGIERARTREVNISTTISLVTLNDTKRYSFNDIAKQIQEHL